jgi:protocatechuate 3,4-dioxygenase beta subunit
MTNPTPHGTSRRTAIRSGLVAGAGTAVLLSIKDLAGAATATLPSRSASAALSSSAGCATLTPEETQGPFWVDELLNRSDIRADSVTGAVQGGIPLTLTIKLQDVGASCAPQVGAYVDIWHANAQGAYSDVSGQGNPNNVGVDWLRGYQVSDENGEVTFTTIYPGWYTGRTIHIHMRIRLALDSSTTVNFTSQIFFDESVNSAVVATAAYQKSGTRILNANDGIYDAVNLVTPTGNTTSGYAATFVASLDFGDGTTDSSGTGGSTGSDQKVAAKLVDATVVRRRGRRVVVVHVRNREKVAGKLRLVRHDDVLAQRTWSWLPAGKHTLRLRVPKAVDAGAARVVLNLADQAGNARITRKKVTVPSS